MVYLSAYAFFSSSWSTLSNVTSCTHHRATFSGRERDIIRGQGQFECLIATTTDPLSCITKGSPVETKPATLGPVLDAILHWVLPPGLLVNYAISHTAAGVAGSVVIDMHLDHIPPKRRIVNGGSIREVPRKRMAYLSNLAVAPTARRLGIGRELLRRAETVALSWGCRSVALHVDSSNRPAVELYESAGYRFVAWQPEWQRMMEGRSNPLSLMVRVLPRRCVE